jgi:hypothetical protein
MEDVKVAESVEINVGKQDGFGSTGFQMSTNLDQSRYSDLCPPD